jgi:four helix bundle protein
VVIEGLNRLKVYQRAQELAGLIYQYALPCLPDEEKYGLASQMRRSAASIPANIAEGYGRYYYQESIRFCYLARGSLMELSSHIDLSFSQSYLPDELKSSLEEKINDVLKLIHGYIKYLKQSKTGWNEPGAEKMHESNSD